MKKVVAGKMDTSRDDVLAKLAQSVARGNSLNWGQIFLSHDNVVMLDEEIQRLGRIHMDYLKAFSYVCNSESPFLNNMFRINLTNVHG